MVVIESIGLVIALVVVVVVVFLAFFLLLKLFFEILPSLIVAGVVYWLTKGNLYLTILAFIVSAVIFAIIGHLLRR